MSKKKKYGKWHGRPNPPPSNWHTPDRPVVRPVTGWLDDALAKVPTLRKSDTVVLILRNQHWISILKALHLYGKAHGDQDWQVWRKQIRGVILGTINPNTDDTKPVAVSLSIEDWRKIWKQVKIACQEYDECWAAWFDWLSQTMTKQFTDENITN